jgi:hypothetical protein
VIVGAGAQVRVENLAAQESSSPVPMALQDDLPTHEKGGKK